MKEKRSFSIVRSPGEAFVWFTSMGLTIGLIMVAYLLLIIISHGVRVFWPDQVVQIKLKEGSPAALNGSPYLAGRVVEKREKILKTVNQSDKNGLENTEWQLFIGNKDVYGLGFRFVDYKEIAQVGYPKDILSIERMEYGDAIAVPSPSPSKAGNPFLIQIRSSLRFFRIWFQGYPKTRGN